MPAHGATNAVADTADEGVVVGGQDDVLRAGQVAGAGGGAGLGGTSRIGLAGLHRGSRIDVRGADIDV